MKIPGRLNLVNIPSHALQSEGADSISSTLKEHGLSGVVIFPAYYTEATENGRWRIPPLLNTFEKDIFGKKTCRIERRSPFPHDEKYFRNTNITPVKHKGHEDIWMPFIKKCKSLDLKVFLAMVPIVAFDDVNKFVPRYYDETPFEEYLGFLCPNHPDVMNYAIDSVNELMERYESLCDGLLMDHIEYPAYSMKEIFTCFCGHCRNKAEKLEIDTEKAMAQAGKLFESLKSLIAENKSFSSQFFGTADGINLALSCPNLLEYMRFKIDTISQVHEKISSAIKNKAADKPLGNGAFAPTYAKFTGLDYSRIKSRYDFLSPKLYSQHWSKMLKNTIAELNGNNDNVLREKIINLFMQFTGIDERSCINDELQVSSVGVEKEIVKMKQLSSKPFFPWLNCEGETRELEIKLKILEKHKIKNAFFQEYMFLNPEKLKLIKNYIQG